MRVGPQTLYTPVIENAAARGRIALICEHASNHIQGNASVTAARSTGLNAQLNQPYSAVDDVTHTLRLLATPYGLPNPMLEIRNDLIATTADQDHMADLLAPVLNMGLIEIQRQAKAG